MPSTATASRIFTHCHGLVRVLYENAIPATAPADARTEVTSDISPTAAQARMPVRTATAVAIRNVTECSGGRGAFARRIISTKPRCERPAAPWRPAWGPKSELLGTPVRLEGIRRGD